jgi:hypothetical protein
MKQPIDEFLEKIDSPVRQELIEQKYMFAHNYTDHEGRQQTSTVYLYIDFESQTFKVTPGDGRSEFGFVTGSHKFNMWRATTRCISAAIEFAVETLNLETDVTPITS